MALALASRGIESCIIEQSTAETFQVQDQRYFALGQGSLQHLQRWGIPIAGAPVSSIIVNMRGEALHFDAKPGVPLGHMVSAQGLIQRVHDAVAQHTAITRHLGVRVQGMQIQNQKVVLRTDHHTLGTPLIIGADGKHSFVRRQVPNFLHVFKTYAQKSHIFTVQHAQDHQQRAYEMFFSSGPLATLPLQDPYTSAIVWSYQDDHIDDTMWEEGLRARFPQDLGAIHHISSRQTYPLSLSFSPKTTAHRCIFIGDSVHCMHPVAGQGLNVGIRDIAALEQGIAHFWTLGEDIGSDVLRASYERKRRWDQGFWTALTHGLGQGWTSALAVRLLRYGLGPLPFVKSKIVRYAMGVSSC